MNYAETTFYFGFQCDSTSHSITFLHLPFEIGAFYSREHFRPIILPIQDICKMIAFIYNVSTLSGTELAHAGTFLLSTLSISSW